MKFWGNHSGDNQAVVVSKHLTPVCLSSALIQLMATARAGRGLAFFTFGDTELSIELHQIYGLLVTEKTAVGETV